MKIGKAAGPNGIARLKDILYNSQLVSVFTDIFKLSISLCGSKLFKKIIKIPVPKKMTAPCMNDFRPVALTSVIMKCFEQLVKAFINNSIPVSADPLQFAYKSNRAVRR